MRRESRREGRTGDANFWVGFWCGIFLSMASCFALVGAWALLF